VAHDPDQPDLSVVLPLGPYTPRAARHHVAQVDKPSPDLRDAVLLLTSELVTRAVESAAEGVIELRVWMTRDLVRVEMRGAAEVLSHPRDEASLYSSLVLDQVADRWRLDPEDGMACVWFEIDRHPQGDREYAGRLAGGE
jgi:hypothetical protein